MWIWNTNIYFWQQWPVYLHDGNDHGLIASSTVLPGLLQPSSSPSQAPHSPAAHQHLCIQAAAALPSSRPTSHRTQHMQRAQALTTHWQSQISQLEDASRAPFPGHLLLLQPSHCTARLGSWDKEPASITPPGTKYSMLVSSVGHQHPKPKSSLKSRPICLPHSRGFKASPALADWAAGGWVSTSTCPGPPIAVRTFPPPVYSQRPAARCSCVLRDAVSELGPSWQQRAGKPCF